MSVTRSQTQALRELEETHDPVSLGNDSFFGYDTENSVHELHKQWLLDHIGQEVYFVLNTGGPNFATAMCYSEEQPRGKVVMKVRLGNFRPHSKIYIDFTREMHDKYYEIRQYPNRCNDQHGNPIEDKWRRVMMGQSLARRHGTFYAPRNELVIG